MNRLNERAFDILNAEIKRCLKGNPLDRGSYQSLRRYLDRLCLESGNRMTFAELLRAIQGIVPSFSTDVIRRAAAANTKTSEVGGLLKWGVIATTVSVGLVAIANLPYPMIRTPVAATAPIVLLPSFISMDHNYRKAIANVEQADQLVNQATSAADIERGAVHVADAQAALDRLPVWFLGYQPRTYCTFFGCTWKFTLDEFEQARKQIARMDARIFQENNALVDYAAASADLEAAREAYAIAPSNVEKNQALATQQTAIDQLMAVPAETLAGRLARQQAGTADRDLASTANSVAGDARTSNLVDAAKAFAMQAATLSQNSPHPAARWREIESLWNEATTKLRDVQPDEPGYAEAQTKLAEYQSNISATRIRLAAEENATRSFDQAKALIPQWQSIIARDSSDPQLVSLLQKILNELNQIESGTTPYEEAQTLRQQAEEAQQKLSTTKND
ncbi:MAG: hypothetical protein HC795_04355 [Coleofasciculaceae cyanobacterium RL_1_1]|nr:hypothetical protein [Coleofasciculaceae cyanobacterium RL_1_1]